MLEPIDIVMKLKDYIHKGWKEMGVTRLGISFVDDSIYIDMRDGRQIIVTIKETTTKETNG